MAFGLSAGAVAAIGAVGGAAISADAAGNAADAQKDAANQTNATNRAMSRQQMELQKPFHETGVLANNRLAQLMGLDRGYDTDVYDRIYQDLRNKASADNLAQSGWTFDAAPGWAAGDIASHEDWLKGEAMRQAKAQYQPGEQGADYGSLLKKFSMEDFEADPGYQFRMDEGMRGVEGGAAARGGLLSGAALKAIQKYGQGLASQEYGNAYGRFENDKTNTHNKLLSMVQAGQGSTNQMTNTAGQFARNNADALGAYGNAQAAGYMGQANAINGGIGNATNFYQQGQMIQQQQQNHNQLMELIRKPGV